MTTLKPSTAKLRKELLKLSKKDLIKKCKKKKVSTNGSKADIINRYIKKIRKVKIKKNKVPMQLNANISKQINNKLQSIVPAYIRYILNGAIPMDLVLIIINYLKVCIRMKGNEMNLSLNEELLITSWICKVLKLKNKLFTISSQLLYSHSNRYIYDGYHKHCDGKGMVFTIIQTKYEHIFGLFLSKTTNDGYPEIYISDQCAFVCVIRSSFTSKKAQLFTTSDVNGVKIYYHDPESGPIFKGAVSIDWKGENAHYTHPNIRFNSYKRNYWKGLNGNLLCGPTEKFMEYNADYDGQQEFEIHKIQCFQINIDLLE